MPHKLEASPHVVARAALLVYLVYLAGCTWAYLAAATGRESETLLRFLVEIAAGLPWTLPLLALPTILGHFDPRTGGETVAALVHVLATLGVGVNLLVLNRLCDWGRFLRVQPFHATS